MRLNLKIEDRISAPTICTGQRGQRRQILRILQSMSPGQSFVAPLNIKRYASEVAKDHGMIITSRMLQDRKNARIWLVADAAGKQKSFKAPPLAKLLNKNERPAQTQSGNSLVAFAESDSREVKAVKVSSHSKAAAKPVIESRELTRDEREAVIEREDSIREFLEELTAYDQIHKSVDEDLQLLMRQYVAARNSLHTKSASTS